MGYCHFGASLQRCRTGICRLCQRPRCVCRFVPLWWPLSGEMRGFGTEMTSIFTERKLSCCRVFWGFPLCSTTKYGIIKLISSLYYIPVPQTREFGRFSAQEPQFCAGLRAAQVWGILAIATESFAHAAQALLEFAKNFSIQLLLACPAG